VSRIPVRAARAVPPETRRQPLAGAATDLERDLTAPDATLAPGEEREPDRVRRRRKEPSLERDDAPR
jgi:hypothetical protein